MEADVSDGAARLAQSDSLIMPRCCQVVSGCAEVQHCDESRFFLREIDDGGAYFRLL